MEKLKIIAIVGQTASGKTALGIDVARKFNGEVISADSRSIYKGMDIGTAKPEIDDNSCVEGIVHHGFDIVEPSEHFHALDFQKFAQSKIREILSKGKLPIIVGGTGLYVSGLIDNYDFEGGKVGEPEYDVLQIGVKVDRAEIYERINKRVDDMISAGLIDEVGALKDSFGCNIKSMTGIGYRQICEYLSTKVTLEKAIENIKSDTRHYAKRQMTWFSRDKRIIWTEDKKEAFSLIEKFLDVI